MKNPHAVALGRLGGLKGGPRGGRARAESLSARRRKEIARRAAVARWGQLPTVAEVRTWLAQAGAPLSGSAVAIQSGPERLEDLAVEAARVAPLDATLTRVLPLFFWRNRSRLDPTVLVSVARRRGQSRAIGFFLDLTAELSGDQLFRAAANQLRPGRSSKTYFFPSSAESPFAREAARRNTPDVARRWGFFMNMPFDSFQTLFDKFTHHVQASRAS